ncbi:hypothetical protein KQX54_013351 [Cotesia glomerata]|uniref:Uncharacterized protein n=1 Tax=Cotesia glomerata TaxID=32391 RepID=A0AAV7IHX1_COTGL|nr:hypothetical protein KQX54_013351 [Cotesia glomerata]
MSSGIQWLDKDNEQVKPHVKSIMAVIPYYSYRSRNETKALPGSSYKFEHGLRRIPAMQRWRSKVLVHNILQILETSHGICSRTTST